MRKVWASGGLWAIDRAVIVATSAVVQIILARQLGPEGFGGLSYLLALITLFLPFARMGLSGLLVKAMLEKPEQEPRVLVQLRHEPRCGWAWRRSIRNAQAPY